MHKIASLQFTPFIVYLAATALSNCGGQKQSETVVQQFDHELFTPVPASATYFSFCTKTPNLHFLNATWAAAISHLVEVEKSSSAVWYKKFGFTHIVNLNISATQADWLENKDLAILVFRGTDQFQDFLTDITILSTTVPGIGRFHRGMDKAFTSVLPALLPLLKRAAHKPLWVFGHSLGGALAQIYVAYHLALSQTSPDEFPDLQGFYSFASPGSLAKETQEAMVQTLSQKNIGFFQFLNPHDPTPILVPNFINLGVPFKLEENRKFLWPKAHEIELYFNALVNLSDAQAQQSCNSLIYENKENLH